LLVVFVFNDVLIQASKESVKFQAFPNMYYIY